MQFLEKGKQVLADYFCFVVNQTLRISNLIEDLLKLDEFAESVHN